MKKKKKKTVIWIVIGIIGIVGLGVVIFSTNASSPTNSKDNKPTKTPSIPPPSEEQDNCPYNEKNLLWIPNIDYGMQLLMNKKELIKWKQIPRDYVVKLWKKGYHWIDIRQLWEWNLEEKEIPDLKAEKRIGVINKLGTYVKFTSSEFGKGIGITNSLVVIARKVRSGGAKFNIDKKLAQPNMFTPKNVNASRDNLQKVANLVLQLENNPNYEFFILSCVGAEYFKKEKEINGGNSTGKSSGSAVVLAMLSAYHQKPISRSVAATGSIAGRAKTQKAKTAEGKEIDLPAGTNLPITGLKLKIEGAVEKEIDRFVLSKYQTSPHLLSLKYKESSYAGNEIRTKEKWGLRNDYQKEVPPEIQAKIKEIYWTENISELKGLILEGKIS